MQAAMQITDNMTSLIFHIRSKNILVKGMLWDFPSEFWYQLLLHLVNTYTSYDSFLYMLLIKQFIFFKKIVRKQKATSISHVGF